MTCGTIVWMTCARHILLGDIQKTELLDTESYQLVLIITDGHFLQGTEKVVAQQIWFRDRFFCFFYL